MRSIASIMSVKRGVSERSLKHADRCCFYRRPQGFVQAVPRHDVGLSAKDAGGVFLNIHQFKDSELTSLIVEKQVNIGIVIRFPRAPSRRTCKDVRRQAVSNRLRAAAIGLWLHRLPWQYHSKSRRLFPRLSISPDLFGNHAGIDSLSLSSVARSLFAPRTASTIYAARILTRKRSRSARN